MEIASRLDPGRLAAFRQPLRWHTLDASDLPGRPQLLDELLTGAVDGVIVHGIFSPEEIDRAIGVLDAIPDDETSLRPFGRMLGLPIGMVAADEGDRERYYDDAARCAPLYREAFGFDPFERLATVLDPICGGLRPAAPTEGGRPYNPGQVRWWRPGGGGLVAHVGNEFRAQLEACAMKHLVTVTDIADHLSYFVVLQQPDEGGELSVFDLTWDDDQGVDDWVDTVRDDGWIDAYPSTRFDPGPGSLVLFGGGRWWHRVEPPHGSRPRITYGGFAAPSLAGDELHFWS